jgi:hypothetical protein
MSTDFAISLSMIGGLAVAAYAWAWYSARQFDRKYGKR